MYSGHKDDEMNKKTIFTVAILVLLISLPAAFASVSTVATSMSTSRATTGTSVTGTVTVTATGTESGTVQLVCTPSGVSISDPSTGSYQGVSLSTTPTSKTFTLTAGTANTYTCSGQSGGISQDATIVFVDPTSLTVTGTPTSKSVSASGDTFTLTVNIQNSQSSAITTSYTLSLPSDYSRESGDSISSSSTTIGASSTTSLTWTIKTGSSSGTIGLTVGDNSNAFTSSVTVPSAASTAATAEAAAAGGAATTPGVKVVTAKGSAVITIPSIAAGKSAVVNINKTEDVALTQITIHVKNTNNNIQIVVTKLADRPASITQEISGKVYHYVQIDKTNITDTSVNKTTIKFKVEKSWLNSNSIDDSTVALYRHENNAWNKLTTTKTGSDDDVVFYETESPGLSVFAISGEQKAEVAPTEQAPTNVTKPEEAAKEVAKKGKTLWLIVLIVVVVGGGIAIFLAKSNMMKIKKTGRSRWDELRKKYSR